jgi:hypothetical protein
MAATTFSAFPALFELFPLVSPMAAPIAAQPVMHPALFSRTLEFQLFFLPFFSAGQPGETDFDEIFVVKKDRYFARLCPQHC